MPAAVLVSAAYLVAISLIATATAHVVWNATAITLVTVLVMDVLAEICREAARQR